MKERFPEMPAVIPYKCKAIFAFQYCKQQSRELCFFAMQVQVCVGILTDQQCIGIIWQIIFTVGKNDC